MKNVLKCFGAMSLVLLLLAMNGSYSSAQAQYNPGPGFKISWALNPRADGNFRPVEYFGSSKVEVGMDFDRDGRREILFATDETLSPGGPGEGILDLYLYEATGNDQYAHVWHYSTTEDCNSFPAVTYGDIDKDGKWEIYFGVPTVAPSTSKLFIFEQNDSGVFPDQPTLIWDYNRDGALDFRPSGLKLDDVDKDGKIELISQSRTSGRRELVVAQLVGDSFDDFASFQIEFEAGNDILGGGGTYDVDVVDFDNDGKKEIWYNTWDLFSFEIFEADTANQYSLAVDLDKIFPNENDPGSFNRHDLFFNDIDGDGKLEAWFPMTDGKLYYLDNTDDVSTLTAANFTIVGTIQHSTVATGQTRGTDIGDIDRDGRWDIIVAGGTQEGIFRAEYLGIGSPKDSSSYEWTQIFESVGPPTDYYYPLRISPVDLDGDGLREVVITNRYADDPTQPLILVLEYDPTTADKLADGWEQSSQIAHSEVDALYQKDNTGNSRTVIGGFDLDKDGKKEIIMNDYAAKAVRLFEYSDANKFEMTWMSPPDTAAGVNRNTSNPRVVTVGDLDGDSKWEIIFPLASQPSGWYVYEWDGVTGSDNYGTKYSSVINTEVDTCCGANRNSFSGQHEGIPNIVDVDKDGKQEILLSIRSNATGGKRGLMVTSVEGDIEHNSGGGFETWISEFFVERGGYGGGSPYHAVPADLDGDGTWEIVNHTWNFFNFYNVDVTGPNSYQAPDPASPTRNFQATAPADQVSLFGGSAGDVDQDGNHEVYFANFQTGDLWVIDYNPGDDVLSIDGSHVVNVIPRFANFWTTIFDVDKNGRPNIISGAGFPRTIVSAELTGSNPRDPAAYTTKVIYAGEPDIFTGGNIVVKDSLGVVTTTQSINSTFASKVHAQWNGQPIDFDNDGDYELIASFQSNVANITTLNLTWNATANKYDTVTTTIPNPKSWSFQRFEFTGGGTAVDEGEVSFITPENYVLEQNYPNPFNPSTTITYSLPLNKKVTLRIYDMMGRVVRTLVDDQMQSAGRYKVQWDGRNQHGTRVASGVYLYALEFGNFKKTKSMTLLK